MDTKKTKYKTLEEYFKESEESTQKCCICGKEFAGYGNNAEPVKHGRCCDDCNINTVIPARLSQSNLDEDLEDDIITFKVKVFPNNGASSRGTESEKPIYTEIIKAREDNIFRAIISEIYNLDIEELYPDVYEDEELEENARAYLDDVDLTGGEKVIVSVDDEYGNNFYMTPFDFSEDDYNDFDDEDYEDDDLDESLTQEIGQIYQELSDKFNIDFDELVYGEDGFMNNCYPDGFPDFNGDVIYNHKYWDELVDWAKKNKNLDLTKTSDISALDEKIDKIAEAKNKLIKQRDTLVKDQEELEKHYLKKFDTASKRELQEIIIDINSKKDEINFIDNLLKQSELINDSNTVEKLD